MGELNNKTYLFTYKEDKDYFNNLYKTRYNEIYGQQQYDIQNDFLKGEVKTEVIFSPTPLVNTIGHDRVISKIYGVDTNGQIKPTNSNIRILYYGGLKNTAFQWSHIASSGTTLRTNYAYAGHLDDVDSPTFDLSFGVPREVNYNPTRYTANNLYNKYWRDYIEQIADKDSKLFVGYFYLNEFDSLVIFSQQVDEKADRGLKAPVTDPTDVNMVLPVKATRLGTVLAFNATTGNPEAGPSIASVTTVAAQSANINTVAGISANVTTVAGISANVTTVAGVSSAVTTVAGISANVTTVAGISSNVTTVATNNTNINTVAGVSANVTTVAGISANVTTVAGISGNVTTVAGISANVTTVAGASSAVTTNATNIASINTNATNIAVIQNASTNATNAANSATAAASSATSAANSATAAAASAASGMYSAVQDKSANYTVVAGDAGDLIRVTTTSGAVTITLPTISTVSDGFKIAMRSFLQVPGVK